MRGVICVLAGITIIAIAGAGTAWGQDAPPPPPVSPERYAAIDRVMKASVILDARRPTVARVRPANLACRALPRTDLLVAAYRSTCRAATDAVLALVAFNGCKPIRRCVTGMRRYIAATGAQITAARAMNTRLATEVADPPCRAALRYSLAEIRAHGRLRAAGVALERALRGTSALGSQRALDRFFRVDRRPIQPQRLRLRTFNIACR